MKTLQIIETAENQGFELVGACENEYLIWEKDGTQYGNFIPNVVDFEWYAANEITPHLKPTTNETTR